ncbi:hypothetical protein GE09DRAFT_1061534 [Coniochaeta sp. 2T2.1]|nr:hypothetical protein GE09DRAFT_1061534 [Coniochaeta sp. 2T2.1]
MLSRTLRLTPRAPAVRLSTPSIRPLSTTFPLRAYKDDQDRESLKPKAPYGSQSAGDEAASHNPDSYSRKKTDPSKEKKEQDLDVSGANQDLSKPQGDNAAEESRASGPDRKARSGGSKGHKAGSPDTGKK